MLMKRILFKNNIGFILYVNLFCNFDSLQLIQFYFKFLIMKTIFLTIFTLFLFAFNGYSQDIEFPRQLTNNGSVLTIYHPQVESWNNYTTLVYRMAFSLVPNQQKEVLGVLYMTSNTVSNTQDHTVFLSNMVVNKTMFPSLDTATASTMDALVRSFITPDKTLTVSLDLIAASTPKSTPKSTVTVNNEPPLIFSSTTPAVLLQLEGAPVKAATGQTNLQYVINSSLPLFQDNSSNKYYLYDGLEWQNAPASNGPWTFTKSIPSSLITLAKDTIWSNLKGSTPVVKSPNSKMPQVIYSQILAELI